MAHTSATNPPTGDQDPKKPENGPRKSRKANVVADYTVTLTVDANGNFTYDPTLLRVKKNKTIEFVYAGKFEIMFKESTPGDKLFLSDLDNTLTIRDDAYYAVYHYAAAVRRGSRVFLDSACGDIAVID